MRIVARISVKKSYRPVHKGSRSRVLRKRVELEDLGEVLKDVFDRYPVSEVSVDFDVVYK